MGIKFASKFKAPFPAFKIKMLSPDILLQCLKTHFLEVKTLT